VSRRASGRRAAIAPQRSAGGRAPGETGEITLIGRTLDPEDVAAQTLAAVRAGELYVVTHEEALEPLRRRFRRLEDAMRRRPQV